MEPVHVGDPGGDPGGEPGDGGEWPDAVRDPGDADSKLDAGRCTQVSVRALRPSKQARQRTWKNRHKVSACTSAVFPWEVVLGHLRRHTRSLILIQMVNRHLRHLLATDHMFWQRLYVSNFFVKSFLTKRVRDPHFPTLSLWKKSALDVAYYIGSLHVDQNATQLPSMEALTAYIRKWFALRHGTRCGLCGCRYRHDVYWSLGMRACKLCVQDNMVSAYELHSNYGLDFACISREIAKKVFYISVVPLPGEDRMPHTALWGEQAKAAQYLFWRPHLERLYDLPQKRAEQDERRRSAKLLSSAVRRLWLFQKRVWLEKHSRKSIDCYLVRVFRNERIRALFPYKHAIQPGGPDWAFPEARARCRHTAHTNEPVAALFRRVWEHEDWCV
jgi:hypothetical protein